jgi:histidinol phosphatase-like PHP family hydrolase
MPHPIQLLDLHVHTTDTFPIERMLALANERGAKLGIVEHPAPWALKDDADLRRHIDKLRKFDVYVGLQPIDFTWQQHFSKSLLAEVDYILQDPQIFSMPNGDDLRIWEFDTYVDDTQAFMDRYIEHSLHVLRDAPINIFAWPLFLPVCIARDYYTLWTLERMQTILDAAKARNIAIELNDMAHTPHDQFVLLAKQQGLKFTIGSDCRNQNLGRLGYVRSLIDRCHLTSDDFWLPPRKV